MITVTLNIEEEVLRILSKSKELRELTKDCVHPPNNIEAVMIDIIGKIVQGQKEITVAKT